MEDLRLGRADDPAAGLDRYRRLSELGRGGQGVVWLAEDRLLNRRVALKILDRAATADERVRFRREAEAAARVTHPALCPVYDVGESDDAAWIAMRHAEGGSLASRLLARSGPPTTKPEVDAATALVESLARGLHAAHEAGVVHRDVKPANVLLTKDGEPLLADFGMARDLRADSATITERHHVVGTVPYMAPERLYGGRDVDARADVWALGVTLFELLGGRRPFDGATLSAVAAAVEGAETPSLRKLNPLVDRGLDAVVRTALSKSLGGRYRTALAFADDLARARLGEPVAARPPGPLGRLALRARRRPLTTALVALATTGLVGAIALGGVLYARRDDLAAQEAAKRAAAVERFVEIGFLELAHGEADKSSAAFEAARALAPDDPHGILGRALFASTRSRDYEGALSIVRDAPIRDAAAERALKRATAEFLLLYGRRSEADRAAATEDPDGDPLASFVAGIFLMERAHRGETKEGSTRDLLVAAARHFRNAATFGTESRRIYLYELAHALSHFADATQSADVANALMRLHGEEPTALAWAASLYLRVDPERAIEVAKKARALGHESRHLRRTYVIALRLTKNLEAAAEEARRYVDAYGEDADDVLGSALRSPVGVETSGGPSPLAATSLALAESRVAAAPDDLDAKAVYAQDLARAGRSDEAEALLGEVLRREPDHRDARVYLAELYWRRGDAGRAEIEARRAVLAAPRDPRAHAVLGKALIRAERFEEAVAALARRATLVPEAADARIELGLALLRVRRHSEATDAFETALKLRPDDPRVLCNLGQSLRRAGRPSAALPLFRRGHELGSRLGDWRFPSAEWIATAEGEVAYDRLASAAERSASDEVDDVFEPIETFEALDGVSRLLRERGAAATETRLWEFVARERKDLFEGQGYLRPPRAASAALSAAAAFGAAPGDDASGGASRSEAARLRGRALAWLEPAVDERRARFAAARSPGVAEDAVVSARGYRTEMAEWFSAPAFAVVRDEHSLARIPDAEAESWRAFWRRAALVLSEAP